MNEPSEPHDKFVCPGKHQVKAAVDTFVPVARRFTLRYYGDGEPSGQEYSITLEVLQNHDLPLRLTMGSADSTDLMDRCFQVLKSGFITAKGELVIDRREDAGESVDRCVHLMDVHWFEAVGPPVGGAEVTGAG